jgi:hypothetical protein
MNIEKMFIRLTFFTFHMEKGTKGQSFKVLTEMLQNSFQEETTREAYNTHGGKKVLASENAMVILSEYHGPHSQGNPGHATAVHTRVLYFQRTKFSYPSLPSDLTAVHLRNF